MTPNDPINRDRLAAMQIILWMFASMGLLCLFLFQSCSAHGATVVTKALLDHIAKVESGNNPYAIGKAGELGAYQLKAIAVAEVNRIYGTRYTHQDAILKGPDIARRYLLICERRAALKTPAGVYARYRGFK